jgi:hypothetical protein
VGEQDTTNCEDQNSIVGTWNLNFFAEGFVDSLDTDTVYADGEDLFITLIFDPDGNYDFTMQVFGESRNGSGTWSVTGNELNMIGDGLLEDENPTYDITLSNGGQTLAIYYSHIYDPDLNSVVFHILIFDKEPN